MYIILLKFSGNRGRASQFMDGHKAWVKRGFDDGVFLLAGSLEPDQGGGILAHGISLPDLRRRVDKDPFVAEKVVTADIMELEPAKADERLKFLLG